MSNDTIERTILTTVAVGGPNGETTLETILTRFVTDVTRVRTAVANLAARGHLHRVARGVFTATETGSERLAQLRGVRS